MRIFAALFLVTCVVATQAQDRAAGAPVPYRLLAGATLTTEVTDSEGLISSQTSPLSGTFALTRQLSPLDVDIFALADIRWFRTNSPPRPPITGTGRYSVSSRFGDNKQLTLDLQIDGAAVVLDSGPQPNDSGWPVIDMIGKGSVQNAGGTTKYSLHVIAAPELAVWHYRLLESSSFTDDCPVCDRVSIAEPMRGSFDLVLIDDNSFMPRYIVRDVDFSVSYAGRSRHLSGAGTFQIGGEVALRQDMTLQLLVQSPETNQFKVFTNATPSVQKPWPVIELNLDETEGTDFQVYRLHLLAAPLREIWFSTAASFTSGNADLNNKRISNGDVLADNGRVVQPNIALMRNFGMNPDVSVGIDALTPVPGGEAYFSLNANFTSPTLGEIQHGDLLSNRGAIIKRNQDLLAAFAIMPPTPDVGLDGLQVLDNGEILFSIRDDVFSEAKGVMLSHGDLLSSSGEIRKTQKQLLANFHPDSILDFGLDAVYVWPSGEIWFSTEIGFNDQQLGGIGDGDLLSDQGYVVFRNLEIVSAFKPLEKISNFGSDGLYIVTDIIAPAGEPTLSLSLDTSNAGASLQWKGLGRVFQVQKTSDLSFPFAPSSPIVPGTNWFDAPLQSPSFYRLRQW